MRGLYTVSDRLHTTDDRGDRIKSGRQNKLLLFNKNLTVLSEILDMPTLGNKKWRIIFDKHKTNAIL